MHTGIQLAYLSSGRAIRRRAELQTGGTHKWCVAPTDILRVVSQAPLISLAGSGGGVVVAQYDIGLVLDGQNTNGVITSVAEISSEQLDVWASNIRLLPRRVYEYTDEALQLKTALTT